MTGTQPIWNETNDIVIVYNGEIFNYLTLRSQLMGYGHVFKTKSDTEVIVHAYEEWGERCVDRFNGQFAFAIYDSRDKPKLFIARDRMGEKPLYYARRNGTLFFASEIKALLTQIESEPAIGDEFWAFEAAFEGSTIFKGIHELLPGHYMAYDGETLRFTHYWDVPNNTGVEHDRSEDDLAEELRELVISAVQVRLMADVPLGVALSGGLDSAAIACIAKPEKVFTCSFPMGPQFDESQYAAMVAKKIGAERFTVTPTPEDFVKFMPNVIWHLDTPIATASPIGEFMVTRGAARYVKVLLGGQGADELFGGYARYCT